jgi:hypothetical protein
MTRTHGFAASFPLLFPASSLGCIIATHVFASGLHKFDNSTIMEIWN